MKIKLHVSGCKAGSIGIGGDTYETVEMPESRAGWWLEWALRLAEATTKEAKGKIRLEAYDQPEFIALYEKYDHLRPWNASPAD